MKIDSKIYLAHQMGSHLNFSRESYDQIIHYYACSPENLKRYLDLLMLLDHFLISQLVCIQHTHCFLRASFS